jgi:hypothetical protein
VQKIAVIVNVEDMSTRRRVMERRSFGSGPRLARFGRRGWV